MATLIGDAAFLRANFAQNMTTHVWLHLPLQAATESSAQGGKTEKAVKAEIKSLKGKNASLEKKHTKLTEEKKQLQADNGELQEVIETKNNELASKDKELESMAESTTELAKNLMEKSAEAKDLVERNKSLDEDKTQQLNANEYTVSNLKEQLETAKKGLGIANAEVAGLKASQEASAQTASKAILWFCFIHTTRCPTLVNVRVKDKCCLDHSVDI